MIYKNLNPTYPKYQVLSTISCAFIFQSSSEIGKICILQEMNLCCRLTVLSYTLS